MASRRGQAYDIFAQIRADMKVVILNSHCVSPDSPYKDRQVFALHICCPQSAADLRSLTHVDTATSWAYNSRFQDMKMRFVMLATLRTSEQCLAYHVVFVITMLYQVLWL